VRLYAEAVATSAAEDEFFSIISNGLFPLVRENDAEKGEMESNSRANSFCEDAVSGMMVVDDDDEDERDDGDAADASDEDDDDDDDARRGRLRQVSPEQRSAISANDGTRCDDDDEDDDDDVDGENDGDDGG
jgi:hypothetical protein